MPLRGPRALLLTSSGPFWIILESPLSKVECMVRHRHIRTHTHTLAHAHTHTAPHTTTCLLTHTLTHARTHTHTHSCPHARSLTHTDMYTHTHAHTHSHTRTHTHILDDQPQPNCVTTLHTAMDKLQTINFVISISLTFVYSSPLLFIVSIIIENFIIREL